MTDLPEFVMKIIRHSGATVPESGYSDCAVNHVFSRGSTTVAPSSKVDIAGDGIGIYLAEGAVLEISGIVKGRNLAIVAGADCRLSRLTVSMKGNSCAIIFGAGSTCESATIIVGPNGNYVAFGDDCMVSSGVVVRTDDGHSVFERSSRERIGLPASVQIGAHVWLGNSCRVNKGAIIGHGTIIGQCSIAGGTLDAFSAYAGAPARKVRDNITWSRTRSYDDIPEKYR